MDDKMAALMAQAPERSFILFEDVDAAFNKRVQTSADGFVLLHFPLVLPASLPVEQISKWGDILWVPKRTRWSRFW